MRLLDGYSDFVERSLSKVPGLLAKACFLAEIRLGDHYAHWGMEQSYGREVSTEVLRRVDVETNQRLLRAPISSLWAELEQDSGLRKLMIQLADQADVMLPVNTAAARHTRLVFDSLKVMATR